MNTAAGLGTTYTVLVGVDYSSLSALALTEAVKIARARGRSHIHVVHVAPPPPEVGPGAHATRVEFDEAFGEKAAAELRAYLQGIVGQERAVLESAAESAEQWMFHVRFGDAGDAIAQLASDIEADLVVVGT
ncbi:MAG TPA: universal stress protein, partial [Polyangiaceae bacterium]|nr:universal stress protein [Polyangiaceae bacterium]